MKRVATYLVMACLAHCGEIPMPERNLRFEYDSKYWKPIPYESATDLWIFSDAGIVVTGSVMRLDVGTEQKLSGEKIRELVGEGYDKIEPLMGGPDFIIYKLTQGSAVNQRWVTYLGSGTLAYFICVEAETGALNERKLVALRFLMGLQSMKKDS